MLHLSAKGLTKRVYFQEGRIIFAASTDPNDRLGEMLLREGAIRLYHLERAIARLPEGKRLGTILVEAGHLSPDHLVKGVLRQVRAIVLSLFPWEEGEHTFVEGLGFVCRIRPASRFARSSGLWCNASFNSC